VVESPLGAAPLDAGPPAIGAAPVAPPDPDGTPAPDGTLAAPDDVEAGGGAAPVVTPSDESLELEPIDAPSPGISPSFDAEGVVLARLSPFDAGLPGGPVVSVGTTFPGTSALPPLSELEQPNETISATETSTPVAQNLTALCCMPGRLHEACPDFRHTLAQVEAPAHRVLRGPL
jgi:hypothetical protein